MTKPEISNFIADFDVENYVEDYEFRFDGGAGYTPTETEKSMLIDAIHGALGKLWDNIANA